MTKKSEEQPISNQDNSSKIDAIKDLLFGDNIVEYNSQFESIKNDILKKKEDLEHLIEVTQKSLNEAIDNLSTDLNIRITSLEDVFEEKINALDDKKMNRKDLGDLLIKLGNKISE